MGVLSGCKPRKEVLKGDLEDAIFAADFGDVIAEKAPVVYQDAKTFFRNTHPAQELCKVTQVIFGRLANDKEPGAAVRLSTGFGGGKTHTLIGLWHLANNIGSSSIGTELLPAAGRPKKVKVVAIDASKAGVPEFARHGKTAIKSLWGEIFYALKGAEGLAILGKADDPEASPSEPQIEQVLPDGPILLLLDELVIYMARLSARGQGNLLGVLNTFISVAGKRPQMVIVITDPGDQQVYQQQAAQLGEAISKATAKLDDILGRRSTNFDPIKDESARVIVRRLFESVDQAAAEQSSAEYHALYQRVHDDKPGSVPATAVASEYAKRMVQSYPFHPRLLDTAQNRLGALQEFNKSRGTLRLFARILRSVWESKQDVELITAGEVDWSNSSIQGDLLQRLKKDNFQAAVKADIEQHAGELDGGAARGIHRRVASALLLESIPLQANSGLDAADIALAILRPDEAGPEPAEALERLSGVCWHTYPMGGGRGWQFRYEPNIRKQIEQRMRDVSVEDAKSYVLREAQSYFQGPVFKLAAWPAQSRQVPEAADLQLALCESEKIARDVCAYADNSDPVAPMPRRFVNAIVAVYPLAASLTAAIERAQRLLATENIEREYRTGDAGKLIREQLHRIKPEYTKQSRIQTCRAFERVAVTGAEYPIEEQYQVSDDELLARPQGQVCLKRFLEAKGLLYQEGDALDIALFLKLLTGATPHDGGGEVWSAKSIHERFLSSDLKKLLPNGNLVRATLKQAVAAGKLVLLVKNENRAYDGKGYVQGPEGARKRVDGALGSFELDATVLLTRAQSETAKKWLQEAAAPGPGGKPAGPTPPPPPPDSETLIVTDWVGLVATAVKRPLRSLALTATTPSAAAQLSILAQPLNAQRVALTVTASGEMRDGGSMHFNATEVRPNHATQPLKMAQVVFNAAQEGVDYEATLDLVFQAGDLFGYVEQLKDLADKAPTDMKLKAEFGPPVER